MEIKIISSSEKEWLNKWDEFVERENISNHLLYSDWNSSFKSYGFDYEITMLIEDAEIIGGFAAVIAKALVLKFYIVPFGPVLKNQYKSNLDYLISNVVVRAKKWDCCYCHISLPYSESENSHVYNELQKLNSLDKARFGHKFKYVYSAYGLNWKSVDGIETEEDLINSFRSSVRRYIRSSLRKDLNLKFAEKEEDVKNGYNLCLKNAKDNGYALRDWESFKETILELIQKKRAKFLLAIHDGTIKGASLIVKSANHYTYILGGSVKEKPDFLAGHFLHYSACKLAWDEKLHGYNISLGGSPGVVNLKNSYADEQIYYENSKYYWVIKPLPFKLFLLMEKITKKYKKPIARLLSILKR